MPPSPPRAWTRSGSTAASARMACLDALERFGEAGDGDPARSIMPNAGLPQRLDGQFVYAAEPPWFGSIVPRLLDAGARIVGGCCGTTRPTSRPCAPRSTAA